MTTPDSVEQEATLLTQKEEWVQSVARNISARRGIDPETALAGARWGSLWLDDFGRLMSEQSPKSRTEVKSIISEAWRSSLRRCENVLRYHDHPDAPPSIRAVIVANDAFCMAYGDEAEEVRELLSVAED